MLVDGDGLHHVAVALDSTVVHVGRRNVRQILVGNRRNQYDPWTTLAVESSGLEFRDIVRERLAEFWDSRSAGKRFVKPKRCEDHIDALVCQVLFGVGKVRRTRLQVGRVRRPSEIANHEFVLGKSLM